MVLFIAHTYLVQRDLISYSIKNHMTARQQTQLFEFFGQKDDPTFILTEEGHLTFSNSAALKLFQRSGSIEVSPSLAIFSFLQGEDIDSIPENFCEEKKMFNLNALFSEKWT